MNKILDVRNLSVTFQKDEEKIYAIRNISFSLYEGETLAIVGESGCGKSATAKAIMRLLDPTLVEVKASSIYLEDLNLVDLSEAQMRRVRGNLISMIFQDPMTSLNPTMKISEQIIEGYLTHNQIATKKEAYQKALEMLELVQIPDPKARMQQYPHELSGGMRQRVMMAMALITSPKIVIADEPTTALDVTIQAQILNLFKDIQKKLNMSFIFITHDLSIVANIADRVLVMYGGDIVEEARTESAFHSPAHPYTGLLLKAIPRIDQGKTQPLIPIEGSPPNLRKQGQGCMFFDRCPHAMNICAIEHPPMFALPNDQAAMCWLHDKRAKGNPNEREKSATESRESLPVL